MKRIIAAWTEQILEFDTEKELQVFVNDLVYKACVRGKEYQIISKTNTILHIRIQHNKNQ